MRMFIGAAIYGAGAVVGSYAASHLIAGATKHLPPRVKQAWRSVKEKAEQRAAQHAAETASPAPKNVTPRPRLKRHADRP